MAKGPLITLQVETHIVKVYQEHPKWKAKEVWNWIRADLKKGNPNVPDNWPSLSTVQKILAIYRKNMKQKPVDPCDKPWCMGTLNEYPIPPDAIPAVLKVYKNNEGWREAKLEGFDLSLTIRGAKWVSRLSHVIIDDTEKLSFWANEYAGVERIHQLLNYPFNSSALDYEFARPDRPLPTDPFLLKRQREAKYQKGGTK